MNRKTKYLLLLLGLTILFTSTITVSGVVIDEVRVFGDFDNNGSPGGEKLVFSSGDDFVGIWFNLTEVSPDETIIIEWWSPSGQLYEVTNWTAPFWIQEESNWDMWEDMEIYDALETNEPGVWAADITVEGTWWGHVAFEILADGLSPETDSDSSDEVIRGYYIWVKDVKPVGEVVIGQNTTVEVTIKYHFPIKSPLVPSIFDDQFEVRGDAIDEIQGTGETTYSISMKTMEGDLSKTFYAVAYYYIDGNWTYMDPDGYMAFTLEGDGLGDTGVAGGIDLPEGFDLSGIDVDQITSTLNDTFQRGLDLLETIEVPEELEDIEETIKEQTGIPGFPVEAVLLGVATLGMALRKRY